eukprot:CCRYP_006004-RA/>CCRYP_006004-RA protein AED:0.35 eAED:0.26 QI:0/0/0/1/0/0/2/0/88
MARTFMVRVDDLALWGFAIKHAVWVCQTGCRVLLHWNYSPRHRLIRGTYSGHMYWVVLCLSLTPSFRMARRHPSGIVLPAWSHLRVLR